MTETAARPALSDRYTATSGRVQLTGVQALARLPIDQHRRDLAAGLNVGTFISGYEGSPLAGYDQELGRLKPLLDAPLPHPAHASPCPHATLEVRRAPPFLALFFPSFFIIFCSNSKLAPAPQTPQTP